MTHISVGMKARDKAIKKSYDKIDAQEKAVKSMGKEYKASKWCREMAQQIKRDEKKPGGYKPSGAFIDSLRKHGGMPKVPEHAKAELREKGYRV